MILHTDLEVEKWKYAIGIALKRQTGDVYSLHHNGRRDNVIYMCPFESVTASAVHVVHRTTWFASVMFDKYVHVVNSIQYLQSVNTR